MLQVARNFRVRIDNSGQLLGSISQSSGEFCLTPEVLVLLSLLAEPGSKQQAGPLATQLKKKWTALGLSLPPAGELEGLLEDLVSAGVLVDTLQTRTSEGLQSDGFGDPWVQWTMVADVARTTGYQKAIAKVVQAGDVVVDVGAGTGLLGLMALQAGAKRVVAIEETDTATVATATAKQLGFNKQVYQLVQTNSFDADIPDDTRVVLSELFGNDPFQEGVLPTLRNMACRLKKNKVVFVPHSVTCFAELIDVKRCPQLQRIRAFQSASRSMQVAHQPTQKLVETIHSRLAISELSFPCHLSADDFEAASASISLGSVCLNPPPQSVLRYQGRVKIPVHSKTILHTPAVLLWYRVELVENDRQSLSSSPAQPDFAEHWSPILIPLKCGQLKTQALELAYELNEHENFLSVKIFNADVLVGSR